MKRIVVIGGGITGLAATHRILERCATSSQQVAVCLLEAGQEVGGIVKTEERDGFLLERGPDSFITEKPEALALAQRFGLESQLIERIQITGAVLWFGKGGCCLCPKGLICLRRGGFGRS